MSNPEPSPDFFAVEIFWTIKTLRAFFMLVHACSISSKGSRKKRISTILYGSEGRDMPASSSSHCSQDETTWFVHLRGRKKKHPGGISGSQRWTGSELEKVSHLKVQILGGKSPKEKKLKLVEAQSPPKKHMTKVTHKYDKFLHVFFFFFGGGGGGGWDEYLSCKISDESPSRSCRSCDGDSRLFCSLDLSDGTEEPSAPRLQAKWSKWWRCGEKGPFIFLGLLFVPLPWVILRFPSRNQGINLLRKMRGCLPVNTTPCQLYTKKVYRHGH